MSEPAETHARLLHASGTGPATDLLPARDERMQSVGPLAAEDWQSRDGRNDDRCRP